MPPALFTFTPDGKTLRINIQPEAWKNAPTFAASQIEENASAPKIEGIYKYYAVQMPAFGELERATRVLGVGVINGQDKTLGKVQNLVVDLPVGKVDKVLVASGGFLGIDRDLTALDPQAFRLRTRPLETQAGYQRGITEEFAAHQGQRMEKQRLHGDRLFSRGLYVL